MAYRRPAIEVIQEFQQAAAALSLPTLPACVIGPAFQVIDDVDAGTYSELDGAPDTYAYAGLAGGAIVDLTDAPATEAEANAHKEVGVKLKNALLVKVGTTATGKLAAPNLFQDVTTDAFATFDPGAAGAPTFYVEIVSGAGVDASDLGRKLAIKKNSNNELAVATEWQSGGLPLSNITYRILEFRESIVYPTSSFVDNGISKDAAGVTIQVGLASIGDALAVVEATVLLAWRALRPDVASALTAFTDLASLEAVFGIGSIVPANVGPFVVNLGLQNTTTPVNFTGLSADFLTDEEQAFQTALEFLENKDVYGLSICTHLPAVQQDLKSHVEGSSLSTVGRERIGFFSRKIVTSEIVVPASGIGDVTTAGADDGLSGTDNKTFKDPTNGTFIDDGVQSGYLLEIFDYTAVPGVDRTVTPNERDYLDDAGTIQLTNAAFVVGDVGRFILTRLCTTLANNAEYEITAATSAVKAAVTPVPNTAEVFVAASRAWIADLTRTFAHNAADAVVAATKLWSFVNAAFTGADIGRLIFVDGAANPGNNGPFTITHVLSGTQIRTLEAPGADETFGGGVTQTVYSINREPGRDVSADKVDGGSRTWTILDAAFTGEDVNREFHVAGATNAGNNASHVIEAVLSATQVRTTSGTTPVTEEFNGLTTPTLTTLEIIAEAPSVLEDAYIKGTGHVIDTIISGTQFSLVADPTAGFKGTLENVEYRIIRNMTKDQQADFLAGYATSFGSRRIYSMWPDILAISVNGQATKVPGYFAGGPLVGMCAGLPSQAGFTNLSLVGFIGREHSNDYFSDTQLDTIAGGGNLILVQPVPDAALSVRHQLSTDVSTIFFQELSVTKNVDLIARFFRGLYRPFLGIYNITDGLFDLLKTRGEGGITFLLNQRAPRVGAPIRKGQLSRIEESATQPDSVEIDIGVSVPLPLNNIKLTLLV